MGRPIELATSLGECTHEAVDGSINIPPNNSAAAHQQQQSQSEPIVERPLPPGAEATRIRLRLVSKRAQRAIKNALTTRELEEATRFEQDGDRVFVWHGKSLYFSTVMAPESDDDEQESEESDDDDEQSESASTVITTSHGVQIHHQGSGPQAINVRQGAPLDMLY